MSAAIPPGELWTATTLADALKGGARKMMSDSILREMQDMPDPDNPARFNVKLANGQEFWVMVKEVLKTE